MSEASSHDEDSYSRRRSQKIIKTGSMKIGIRLPGMTNQYLQQRATHMVIMWCTQYISMDQPNPVSMVQTWGGAMLRKTLGLLIAAYLKPTLGKLKGFKEYC